MGFLSTVLKIVFYGVDRSAIFVAEQKNITENEDHRKDSD